MRGTRQRDYPVVWDYMTDGEILEFIRWQKAREEAAQAAREADMQKRDESK